MGLEIGRSMPGLGEINLHCVSGTDVGSSLTPHHRMTASSALSMKSFDAGIERRLEMSDAAGRQHDRHTALDARE
jgi:hypothetical protein